MSCCRGKRLAGWKTESLTGVWPIDSNGLFRGPNDGNLFTPHLSCLIKPKQQWVHSHWLKLPLPPFPLELVLLILGMVNLLVYVHFGGQMLWDMLSNSFFYLFVFKQIKKLFFYCSFHALFVIPHKQLVFEITAQYFQFLSPSYSNLSSNRFNTC